VQGRCLHIVTLSYYMGPVVVPQGVREVFTHSYTKLLYGPHGSTREVFHNSYTQLLLGNTITVLNSNCTILCNIYQTANAKEQWPDVKHIRVTCSICLSKEYIVCVVLGE